MISYSGFIACEPLQGMVMILISLVTMNRGLGHPICLQGQAFRVLFVSVHWLGYVLEG